MVKILDIPTQNINFTRDRASVATQGDLRAASATASVRGGLSKQMGEFARQSLIRDAESTVAEETSRLKLKYLNRLEEYKNEHEDIDSFTDSFINEYDEEVNGIIENSINPYTKDDLLKQSNVLRSTLASKAVTYQGGQKNLIQQQKLQNAINNNANSVLIAPDDYHNILADAEYNIEAARGVMQPADFDKFKLQSQALMAKARIMAEIPRSTENARMLLSNEAYLNVLTPDVVESLQVKIDKQEQAKTQSVLRQRKESLKLYTDDPYTLALKNGANPEDIDDIKAKQYIDINGERIKVPPESISLLSSERASLLSNRFNNQNQQDEIIALFDDLKANYEGENFGIVMRDLRKAGLEPSMVMIGHMDKIKDADMINAVLQVRKSGRAEVLKNAKSFFAVRDSGLSFEQDFKDVIYADVANDLEALTLEKFSDESINDIRETLVDLASVFYNKGLSVSEATKKATNWYKGQYNLGEVNDKLLRIPKSYGDNVPVEPYEIEYGLDSILRNLDPNDIRLLDMEDPEIFTQDIIDNGYWTLNSKGNGYELRKADSFRVRRSGDSGFYVVSIEDILKKNEELLVEQEQIQTERQKKEALRLEGKRKELKIESEKKRQQRADEEVIGRSPKGATIKRLDPKTGTFKVISGGDE